MQVVAEGIAPRNRAGKRHLVRNVAALRNFQCNVCLRKIITLCRQSLNIYQDELDPAEHTKER